MDDRHWRLLVRQFSGEASAAERDELRAWVNAEPGRAAEIERLRALWEATGTHAPPAQPRTDAAWQRVAARTGVGRAEEPRVIPLHPRRSAGWRTAALRVAAVLVVGFAAALLTPQGGGVLNDHVLGRTIRTGTGQQRSFTLADGTRVRLGVQSRLTVPRWFRGDRRDVRLTGAAYFEVAHDARRPFSVYTADAVTRVLGTRFSVRDYGGAEPARIAVTEGRVAVLPSRAATADLSAAAILTRGQAAEVNGGARAAVVRRADERRDLARPAAPSPSPTRPSATWPPRWAAGTTWTCRCPTRRWPRAT